MGRFEDMVVLLTGAASGIGKASILRMAGEGATVVCADIQAEAAEATAKEARELGAKAISLTLDVSDPTSVEAAINQTIEEYGRIDSLCNIAGILRFDNTHELALEHWNQILAVNLTGTFLMTKAALPHLLATKGALVNMASTAGLAGQPWSAAYSASKGGVLSFTRTIAVEYGKQGMRANSVSPGGILTPIQKKFKLPEGADASLLQRIMPLDVMRPAEAAAAVVAFLASPDSIHINGETIRVDGGTLA
ncbi:MAG: meso-butanediol dehydrogenase/(S,S)-butanediol dehydrogenase/diacetyl reductase [Myxococcota bacterium]|jgi:meso-butanediol dehydrogenase/(S,S)-butanediol dehydrogenase/diacetyl reductase